MKTTIKYKSYEMVAGRDHNKKSRNQRLNFKRIRKAESKRELRNFFKNEEWIYVK